MLLLLHHHHKEIRIDHILLLLYQLQSLHRRHLRGCELTGFY